MITEHHNDKTTSNLCKNFYKDLKKIQLDLYSANHYFFELKFHYENVPDCIFFRRRKIAEANKIIELATRIENIISVFYNDRAEIEEQRHYENIEMENNINMKNINVYKYYDKYDNYLYEYFKLNKDVNFTLKEFKENKDSCEAEYLIKSFLMNASIARSEEEFEKYAASFKTREDFFKYLDDLRD